jgi:hypothetical protein
MANHNAITDLFKSQSFQPFQPLRYDAATSLASFIVLFFESFLRLPLHPTLHRGILSVALSPRLISTSLCQ